MRLVEQGLCTSCCSHVDGGLVDFEIAYDGAPVLDRESLTIAISPWDGMPMSHDNLLLCKACVRQACEEVNVKPELHQRQLREINRLQVENDGLREMLRRRTRELEQTTNEKLGPPPSRPPGRPRKQPVGA